MEDTDYIITNGKLNLNLNWATMSRESQLISISNIDIFYFSIFICYILTLTNKHVENLYIYILHN